jgi:hypothetical protein
MRHNRRFKRFRRVATRYEKWGVNYLAMVTLAAVTIWLLEQGRWTSYRIVCGNQALGTSELEYRHSAQGIAFAMFHPLPSYQAVRPVFLHFTAALPLSVLPDEVKLADYYAARDRLGLILETEDGTPLSTVYIHIVDWGEGEEEPMKVEVQILDPRFVW